MLDGRIDEGPDAAIDAAIDAPPDAPIDAAPQFSVTSVATDDGFTEVRQGSTNFFGEGFTAHLVVTGALLGDVDTVTVGPLPCTVTSATATQVLCDLDVPHGYPPGPLTVTATSPTLGATVAPNPITITFVTVGPNAPAGGRGTHLSPFNLCDIAPLDFGGQVNTGDTVDLLAGTHTCTAQTRLTWGVDVHGAGVGTTIIGPGFGGFDVGDSLFGVMDATTHMTGLSVVDPTGPVFQLDTFLDVSSGLVVDGLAVTGGSSEAVLVTSQNPTPNAIQPVDIQNLSYDAAGDAIHLPSSGGRIAHATIKNCQTAINLEYQGMLDVSDTTIDGCAIGIRLSTGMLMSAFDTHRPAMNVQTTQIHAGQGARLDRGRLTMVGAGIVATGAYGILVNDGVLTLTMSQVSAADTALAVFTFSSGDFDHSAVIGLDGDDLVGGRVGVEFANGGDPGHLTMSHSNARGGDFGLIWDDGDPQTSIDIGNGNDLAGSGFAYLDGFDHPAPFGIVNAVGTTLNGRSYAGQTLVGPSELAPDYKIVHQDATTQF